MKLGTVIRANRLALLLVIAGIVGFTASFVLTVDKFKILQDPSYTPSCSINPILSCGSVMKSSQASVFGFANSLIGVAAFAAVVAIGLALLAGARFKRWFWQLMQLAAIFGLVFAHWLMFQSLYRLGTLCPYCIVVWVTTIPVVWYLTLHNAGASYLGLRKTNRYVRFARSHHGDVLLLWYLAIAALILVRFWYYWKTLI